MITHLSEQEIFGRRVRQARERAGFTLRALSEEVEKLGSALAFPTLANYEAGRFLPDEANLVALARALKTDPGSFFRPFRCELTDLHFRKKRSFGAKDRTVLEARAEEFFEHYFEIEELTGALRNFESPKVSLKRVATADEAEEYANLLRKAWDLGVASLPVVTELLEEKGIKIYETKVETAGFDGLQADAGSVPVIILNAGTENCRLSVPRRRLTAVHELGHAVLPLPKEIDQNETLSEPLVWRFAGAFMLPKEVFVSAFGQKRTRISLEELIQLKLRFRASIWAIMRRAQELELISRASYDRFCRTAKEQKWHTVKEPGDDLFPDIPRNSRFCALARRAASENLISESRRDAMLRAAGERPDHKNEQTF